MNRSYLPSRRIVALIITLSLIGIGIWLVTSQNSGDLSQVVSDEERAQLQETDTDEDGLADWEESLWNTDVNEADTDGDGTEDGVEVESGRHPKIPGPNDEINQDRVDAVYSQEATVRENKTDKAWRDLLPYMASYISVSNSDQKISEEQKQQISEKIAREVSESTEKITEKTTDDITVNADPSFQELDTYFENLTEATAESYSSTEMENELLIFAQAVATDSVNEDQLVGLEVIATDYRGLTNKLTKLSVPENLATIHVDLINNYLALAQATENMAALQTDPIRAMAGLSKYQELLTQQQEIGERLGTEIGRSARSILES